jgi:hypothetical protein
MPFARHSGYSFSTASVKKNAPAWDGIYGLSNAQGWGSGSIIPYSEFSQVAAATPHRESAIVKS